MWSLRSPRIQETYFAVESCNEESSLAVIAHIWLILVSKILRTSGGTNTINKKPDIYDMVTLLSLAGFYYHVNACVCFLFTVGIGTVFVFLT